ASRSRSDLPGRHHRTGSLLDMVADADGGIAAAWYPGNEHFGRDGRHLGCDWARPARHPLEPRRWRNAAVVEAFPGRRCDRDRERCRYRDRRWIVCQRNSARRWRLRVYAQQRPVEQAAVEPYAHALADDRAQTTDKKGERYRNGASAAVAGGDSRPIRAQNAASDRCCRGGDRDTGGAPT